MFEITTDSERFEVEEQIREMWNVEVEVIYCHEAIDIITSAEWDEYDIEPIDFSSCNSAMDAIMLEANAKLQAASYVKQEKIVEEETESIMSFVEVVVGEGFEGKITFSNGSIYGWAVHQKEDVNGVCFYYDLESEKGLTAIEHSLGNRYYMSVCFNNHKEL